MKKAISIWNNRIAPVFDESQECIIIEEDYSKSEVQKLPLGLEDKIQFLLDNEVSTLICGAISRFAENQLLQNNIDVSPFVAGSVSEVISALEEGKLYTKKFAMPGCPRPFVRRGFGMGRGMGCGAGRGPSAGFGRGREFGMGMGSGRQGSGRGLGLGYGLGPGRGLGLGYGRGFRQGAFYTEDENINYGQNDSPQEFSNQRIQGDRMKIAISATGKDLNAKVDLRFGRAQNFIIYNTEDKSFVAIDNTQNLNAPQGAGIQSAQHIVDSGASVLITGNTGPKAFRVLEAGNIEVFLSEAISVQEAIERYMSGSLEKISQANVEGHW